MKVKLYVYICIHTILNNTYTIVIFYNYRLKPEKEVNSVNNDQNTNLNVLPQRYNNLTVLFY